MLYVKISTKINLKYILTTTNLLLIYPIPRNPPLAATAGTMWSFVYHVASIYQGEDMKSQIPITNPKSTDM